MSENETTESVTDKEVREIEFTIPPAMEFKREPEAPTAVPLTPENVAMAAAITYVFMVLLFDKAPVFWTLTCQKESFKYPGGSFRGVFWWALRTRGEPLFKDHEGFFSYFKWKWDEFETGRIDREGSRL